MSETPVFTDLRRTFEWTCPECGSDHYDVGDVDGQILTCEGCSKTVLVRWPGLSAEGVVAEEPEWEYRSHVVNDLKRHILSDWTDEETALAIIGWESGRPREDAWIERRRPAGDPERVPVKQEGAE